MIAFNAAVQLHQTGHSCIVQHLKVGRAGRSGLVQLQLLLTQTTVAGAAQIERNRSVVTAVIGP